MRIKILTLAKIPSKIGVKSISLIAPLVDEIEGNRQERYGAIPFIGGMDAWEE